MTKLFKDFLRSNALGITPEPSKEWKGSKNEERYEKVKKALNEYDYDDTYIELVDVKTDGQVIFKIKKDINSSQRGSFLLDLEFYLKESVGEFLFINIEPMGDKNSLRKLRGIDIKKENN